MPGLSDRLLTGPLVPVVLLLAALAVVLLSMRGGPQEPAAPADVPHELWRCRACAKTTGKGWIPCRSVTGRGNEQGAADRVKAVVCEEAGVPLADCELTNLSCSRLEEHEGGEPGPARAE